jgi:lactoylglutathione lyase
MRFLHTSLRVRDPDVSLAFYRELGFEPRGRLSFPETYFLYLGLAGSPAHLELAVNRDRTGPYDLGDGFANIALAVDDLDGLLARLAEAGIQPELPAHHPGGRAELRIALLRDPDGYRIELVEGDFEPPQDPP